MAPSLRRSHSWPPFKLQLHSPFTTHTNRNIDDDPFSFFISTNDADDDEAFATSYLSASILPTQQRARSLSPLRSSRRRREHNATGFASEDAKAIRMLKKWMRRMEPKYFDRKRKMVAPEEWGLNEESPEVIPQQLFPLSPPLSPQSPGGSRGRAHLRKPVRDVERDGTKRQVRSHSGRPRLWRAPESDIWTVREEREDEQPGLGIVL